MTRFSLLFLLTLLFFLPLNTRAEESARPVADEDTCSVPADERWAPQEKFVWARVCVGKDANFNEEPGYGGELDPKKPEGLPASRILQSSFVETILLKHAYRRALTRRGVRIVGARFDEVLDLEGAEIAHDLKLLRCSFEQGVNFVGLRSAHALVLDGSKASAKMNMDGLHVRSDVFMGNGAKFTDIALNLARIEGYFGVVGAKVQGAMEINGTHIGASANMTFSSFGSLNLNSAHVDGHVQLYGSEVEGWLGMDQLHVGRGLFMAGEGSGTQFHDVWLSGAHINTVVDLQRAIVRGKLTAVGLEVDGDTRLDGGQFDGLVELGYARIKGNLMLGSSVDANNRRFESRLRILNLTNTNVGGKINLTADAWPSKFNVDGFAYRDVDNAENFKQWFDKHDHYSLQPYTQLASVVQAKGDYELATAIRFAGRDRERHQLTRWAPWIWLTMLWATIGYGYYPQLALGWVVLFVIVGAVGLRLSEQSWRNGLGSWSDKIVFSIDTLLPIIRLREKNYHIDLRGGLAYYFYFHKIMGYVLASFLIAGLSGLTK